jgi:hypothetical protein
MTQGEQIHISTWPDVWPASVANISKKPEPEESSKNLHSKDTLNRSNYDSVAANRTRAAAHCFENKFFGTLYTGYLDTSNIDAISLESSDPQDRSRVLNTSSRGATMFLDPTRAALSRYVVDPVSSEKSEKEFLQKEEGILYAELDLYRCVEAKQYHDVVGISKTRRL